MVLTGRLAGSEFVVMLVTIMKINVLKTYSTSMILASKINVNQSQCHTKEYFFPSELTMKVYFLQFSGYYFYNLKDMIMKPDVCTL
jgi:hypothetical protein